MSEQRHTPGPWTVVPYGDGDSLVVHSDNEHRVCFMSTPGESPGAMQKIKANAQLISASPDMYEALKEIAKGEGRFSMDPLEHATNTIEDMVEIARAAIAKAEGKRDQS